MRKYTIDHEYIQILEKENLKSLTVELTKKLEEATLLFKKTLSRENITKHAHYRLRNLTIELDKIMHMYRKKSNDEFKNKNETKINDSHS